MAFEYLLIALVWNKVDIKVGQYEELNTCLRSAEILENHVANDYSQGYPDKINDSFAELQKLINLLDLKAWRRMRKLNLFCIHVLVDCIKQWGCHIPLGGIWHHTEYN